MKRAGAQVHISYLFRHLETAFQIDAWDT